MNYTVNHPSKDFVQALGLSADQISKIDNAVHVALNAGCETMDQVIGSISGSIDTPEEAFYAATIINAIMERI